MTCSQFGHLSAFKKTLENQPRSIVTNLYLYDAVKGWIIKIMLNQLRNTSTYQSTNRPQHGGASDVQHHALQEIRNEIL